MDNLFFITLLLIVGLCCIASLSIHTISWIVHNSNLTNHQGQRSLNKSAISIMAAVPFSLTIVFIENGIKTRV